ncbi:deoxynucleotide monophosphate kinase [Salmonella enterica subsp. enterica serovar Enteritidis]|nr:deoxynucleotide monophosphate kinase [Salmonella enterica subsp. enterica serovar Enteritidis]
MQRLIGLAGLARSGKDTVAAILNKNYNTNTMALADPLKQGCQALFGLSDAETWQDNLKEQEILNWKRSPRQLFQEVGTDWMRAFNPEFWLMRADREIINHSTPGIDAEMHPHTFSPAIMLACKHFFGFSNDQLNSSVSAMVSDPFWKICPFQAYTLIKSLTLRSFPDWNAQREAATIQLPTHYPIANTSVQTLVIKDIRFENEADFIRSRGGKIWHIKRHKRITVNSHTSEAGIITQRADYTINNNGTLRELEQAVTNLWNACP